jgi:hypothetical protein
LTKLLTNIYIYYALLIIWTILANQRADIDAEYLSSEINPRTFTRASKAIKDTFSLMQIKCIEITNLVVMGFETKRTEFNTIVIPILFMVDILFFNKVDDGGFGTIIHGLIYTRIRCLFPFAEIK